ncbi:unnamed protein product [Eruca vesicaria subsp. sativa]|uniref:Uncharacterized protein n=1 Tax=Eruca vesicaria subsp. sativa TaxID=29727 RepID=A0ABC8J0L3_ERUVS|nr:unnamed protein product [Eruca vesicaria subsp. sativa]
MVLTDEHGDKIHAMCKKNEILNVKRKLPLENGVFSQRSPFHKANIGQQPIHTRCSSLRKL